MLFSFVCWNWASHIKDLCSALQCKFFQIIFSQVSSVLQVLWRTINLILHNLAVALEEKLILQLISCLLFRRNAATRSLRRSVRLCSGEKEGSTNSFRWLVRFPNPLAPDIQIHVSWGTWLLTQGKKLNKWLCSMSGKLYKVVPASQWPSSPWPHNLRSPRSWNCFHTSDYSSRTEKKS